jgi:type I restriction enzyme M protein
MMQCEKASLDIFWLKDESLEDSDNLPEPEVLAAEIVENLESALEQFKSIYEELGKDKILEPEIE